MIAASLAILWLATAYLVALGLAAVVRPAWVRMFLAGFAQTTTANLVEVGLRLLVGLAFAGAAERTRNPLVAIVIGSVLVVSALLMLLLPGVHRHFAARSTSRLSPFILPFGLASLGLALALGWFTA